MPAVPGSAFNVTSTITAFTGTNSQSGTDSGSATITIDNLSPANVTGATTTPGDTQITISWTNPGDSDFSNVVVIRATSLVTGVPTEGSSPAINDIIGNGIVRSTTTGTSLVDTGLTNGTAYFYRIFSKDTYGNYSATGVEVSGTPVAPLPGQPGTPTYSNVSTSTLTVNWTAATDADYYKIERDTDGNAPMTEIATTTALSFNDSGLATSTTYFYRVRATNTSGDGSYSASSSATTSGGGFSPSGSLISLIIDTAVTAGVAPNSLFWEGSPQPANTTVKFQFSASNATSGPWTYTGWNSSTNSCDSSSFYIVGPATPIEIKASCHQNKRYIRYKVFLETTDSAATPRVDRIILNYAP
ncbi:MAG: fibronectin type III domain-containing protein [Candidatus Brennerbacteria bacterium]|nr:fibronectin type III domain-containing protein [Candidatus Brennerbacteria bacterium]